MNDPDQATSDLVNKTDSANIKFTKVSKDYSELMGQKVKVIFKNGKTNDVIGVYATSDNTTYTVNQADIDTSVLRSTPTAPSCLLTPTALRSTPTARRPLLVGLPLLSRMRSPLTLLL